MKVSVLIATLNEERFIAKCLDSVLSNDFPKRNFEILVIDGMSTDRTRHIIQDFISRNKNIRLLDNPNRQVPFAWNIGVKNSTGGVIIILGAHSEVPGNYISACLGYLESTNADCVGTIWKPVGTTVVGKAIAMALSMRWGPFNLFNPKNPNGFVKIAFFGAYRRSVFERIGFFDESLLKAEDYDFNLRLVDSGGTIFQAPEIAPAYYSRGSFGKLFRQYFNFGLYKFAVMFRHSKTVWLAASAYLAAFFVILLAIFFPPAFLVVVIGCLLLLLAQSVIASAKKPILLPLVFFAFAVIYCSFAIGTIFSLLSGRFFSLAKQRKTKNE